MPCGFVVLKAGRAREAAELQAECVARVREEIGPVAAFRTVHIVKRLPKTRSGKILRATMRQIAEGETPKVPATIDDPAILEEIRAALAVPDQQLPGARAQPRRPRFSSAASRRRHPPSFR